MIGWQCRGFRQKRPDRTFRTSHPVRMGCKPSSGALSATGASDAGSVQGGAPISLFRPTDRAAAPTPARQTPVPASMQLPFGSSAFRPAPARSFAVSSAPRSSPSVKGSVSASASCSPNRQARSSADRTRRVAARSARPEDPGTAEPLVADFAWPCIPEWTCAASAHAAGWSQRLIGHLRCSRPRAASSATSHPAEPIARRTALQESFGRPPSSVRRPCAFSAKPKQGIGYTAESGA